MWFPVRQLTLKLLRVARLQHQMKIMVNFYFLLFVNQLTNSFEKNLKLFIQFKVLSIWTTIHLEPTTNSAINSNSYWEKYLEYFNVANRRFVRCDLCLKFPDTVKRFSYGRVPPIFSNEGTCYRSDTVTNHTESDYHKECILREKEIILAVPKNSVPIRSALRTMDLKQFNYVGKLVTQVFVDAKCLTLPAFNWPARFVASEASNYFAYEQERETIPDLSLQYINPVKHLELLSSIVSADAENIKKTIGESLAVSLRVDGSIDKAQKDKISVL